MTFDYPIRSFEGGAADTEDSVYSVLPGTTNTSPMSRAVHPHLQRGTAECYGDTSSRTRLRVSTLKSPVTTPDSTSTAPKTNQTELSE